MATDAPPTDREVIQTLLNQVGSLSTGLKEVTGVVQQLKSAGLVGDDVKKVMAEYEKMRAMVETMQETLRTKKGALWFPGVEDAGKKFNLLRLCGAMKRGDPKKYAPYEMEVVDAAHASMEKQGMATRSGHVMWDDQSAGIWVPDQVIADVIGPIYTQSVFVALDASTGKTRVSVIDGLTGNPVKIPEFEGGMIAYWIGEEDNYAESKTKSGNLTMTPKKLGVLTRITEEMMNLASPAFDAFMRRDMVRAAAKKLDYTVPYGTGTANMPMGLKNNPKIAKFYAETGTGTVGAGNGGELDFDKLMELQGVMEDTDVQIEPSYATISSPRYFRRLKKAKVLNFSGQTTGQPYLLGAPFLSDSRLRDLIGDFDRTTQIPSNLTVGTATSRCGDVFAGNMSEIVVGRWSGIQLLDDQGQGTGFISDQRYVKMRMWADVQVRQPKAIRHVPDAYARD